MAFVPTQADFDRMDKQIAANKSAQKRFIPSAQDFANEDQILRNNQVNQPPESLSDRLENILKSLGHHAARGIHSDANFVRGIRDAITNLGVDSANIIPGVNINRIESAQGPAYEVGKVAGNVAGFMGGGEGLEALRAGSEALPYVGKIAQALSGSAKRDILKRSLGTAAYGALTNPNERLSGAAEGAVLSPLGDLLPYASSGVGKLTSLFKPKKYAKGIMDMLNPEDSVEEGKKAAAQATHDAYMSRIGAAHDLYSPVFDSVGNHSIYNKLEDGRYPTLDKDIISSYDKDLNKLHNKFIESPTFENAHSIRRQLNHTISQVEGALKKRGYSKAEIDDLHNLRNAKTALNSDMMEFLDKKDPVLSNQYRRANDYWRTHVVPYSNNNKLYRLATGAVKNPKSLSTIFSSPEEDTIKVLQDLPESLKHNVIYEKLGKSNVKEDPSKLLSTFNKLDEQGLGEYITPSLTRQMERLSDSIGRKKALHRVAGVGMGALLAHALGPESLEMGGVLPGALEAGAAGLGALAAPGIFKGIERNVPIETLSDLIRSGSKKAYPLVTKAGLAQI